MLDLPKKISIKDEKGNTHKDYPMWIYWFLREGCLEVDPNFQKTDDGKMPPVIHVDSDSHLFSDVDGSLITDKMWGIYYKPDFNFNGVQGGTVPYKINKPADDVKVDPYGIDSKDYQTSDEFTHMWCSALAHCQKRFEGKIKVYKKGPSGGLGCFTPDSFPIFDRFCENVYVIADSNHGYKMIGVGDLVSDEILGQDSSLLKPFRFARYAKGELHPVSNSPFPWS
jgi:glycine/D-amino acid oxidase-like deaminating enzyme